MKLAIRAGLTLAMMLSLMLPMLSPSASIAAPTEGRSNFVVRVANESATCVWVSVAYATAIERWEWLTKPHNTARFLRQGEAYEFREDSAYHRMGFPLEIKVEGTFMEHSDCSGKHAREITSVKKGIGWDSKDPFSATRVTSILRGKYPGDYAVTIHG